MIGKVLEFIKLLKLIMVHESFLREYNILCIIALTLLRGKFQKRRVSDAQILLNLHSAPVEATENREFVVLSSRRVWNCNSIVIVIFLVGFLAWSL